MDERYGEKAIEIVKCKCKTQGSAGRGVPAFTRIRKSVLEFPALIWFFFI